jgi:hypothetical protein
MITFRIAKHSVRDAQVVEIFDGDRLMGVIYAQEWGIRLVSKYLKNSLDQIAIDPGEPVALEVRLP